MASQDNLQTYREYLVNATQKAQDDYDKAVLSLSGGALGISFAFVKDVVGEEPLINPNLLLAAWFAWGLSVSATLISLYTSHRTFKVAIKKLDEGTIRANPGGWTDRATIALNLSSMVLFLLGVTLIIAFVSFNVR
jgi:hypothetical protein